MWVVHGVCFVEFVHEFWDCLEPQLRWCGGADRLCWCDYAGAQSRNLLLCGFVWLWLCVIVQSSCAPQVVRLHLHVCDPICCHFDPFLEQPWYDRRYVCALDGGTRMSWLKCHSTPHCACSSVRLLQPGRRLAAQSYYEGRSRQIFIWCFESPWANAYARQLPSNFKDQTEKMTQLYVRKQHVTAFEVLRCQALPGCYEGVSLYFCMLCAAVARLAKLPRWKS